MRRAIADIAHGIGAAVDLVVTCKSPEKNFLRDKQAHWLARQWRTAVAILGFSIPNNIEGGSISPFRRRRRIGPSPTVPGADVMVKEEGAAPFAEPERRSELLRCWKS